MRTVLMWALCAGAGLASVDRGLPARSSPADYPAQASDKGVTIGADVMDPEQVRGSFSTELQNYIVVEVGVYPTKDGKPLDLSTIDFALRLDGRIVRPAEVRSIARVN